MDNVMSGETLTQLAQNDSEYELLCKDERFDWSSLYEEELFLFALYTDYLSDKKQITEDQALAKILEYCESEMRYTDDVYSFTEDTYQVWFFEFTIKYAVIVYDDQQSVSKLLNLMRRFIDAFNMAHYGVDVTESLHRATESDYFYGLHNGYHSARASDDVSAERNELVSRIYAQFKLQHIGCLYAFWELSKALERGSDKWSDARITSAAHWMISCGWTVCEVINAQELETGYFATGKYYESIRHGAGVKHFRFRALLSRLAFWRKDRNTHEWRETRTSMHRWYFWKQQFSRIAYGKAGLDIDDGISEECQRLAEEALARMDAIEQKAGLRHSAVDVLNEKA